MRLEAGEVSITGSDPFYRKPFRVGETAAAVLATTDVAANDLWDLRSGRRQAVSIAVPEAAATLRVVDYTRMRDTDVPIASIDAIQCGRLVRARRARRTRSDKFMPAGRPAADDLRRDATACDARAISRYPSSLGEP
jgi:hypothetical protein